jgi:hypothetical protein
MDDIDDMDDMGLRIYGIPDMEDEDDLNSRENKRGRRGKENKKDTENNNQDKQKKSNNNKGPDPRESSKKIRSRISRNDPDRGLKFTVYDILDDLEKLIDDVNSKANEEEKIDTGITVQTSEITVSGSTDVNPNGDFPTKEVITMTNSFPIV